MKDTHQSIVRKIKNLMTKKSGEERLMMGFSMFEMAKKLMIASFLSKSTCLNQTALKKALFLRFYGNDFSPEMKSKVLRSWHKKPSLGTSTCHSYGKGMADISAC